MTEINDRDEWTCISFLSLQIGREEKYRKGIEQEIDSRTESIRI